MELEHRFELPVGVETAWTTLLDIEKVGPCFPGASLDSVQGDEFTGSAKVKFGPINLSYKGKAKIVEQDPVAHRAKIEASGNASSASTAAMLVTATVTALSPSRSAVDLVTTLSITGRPAQFGRGVMVEVGNNLIGQFADNVSNQLAGRTMGGAELLNEVNPDEVAAEVAAAGEAAADLPAAGPYRSVGAHRVPGTGSAPEPINLLQAAGAPVAKRVAPVLLALLAFVVLRRIAQRRRGRTAAAG